MCDNETLRRNITILFDAFSHYVVHQITRTIIPCIILSGIGVILNALLLLSTSILLYRKLLPWRRYLFVASFLLSDVLVASAALGASGYLYVYLKTDFDEVTTYTLLFILIGNFVIFLLPFANYFTLCGVQLYAIRRPIAYASRLSKKKVVCVIGGAWGTVALVPILIIFLVIFACNGNNACTLGVFSLRYFVLFLLITSVGIFYALIYRTGIRRTRAVHHDKSKKAAYALLAQQTKFFQRIWIHILAFMFTMLPIIPECATFIIIWSKVNLALSLVPSPYTASAQSCDISINIASILNSVRIAAQIAVLVQPLQLCRYIIHPLVYLMLNPEMRPHRYLLPQRHQIHRTTTSELHTTRMDS